MCVYSKSLNVAIFSDTINMTNAKLCMMVVVTELDCISRSQQCKNSFIWLDCNFVRLLITSSRSCIYHYF